VYRDQVKVVIYGYPWFISADNNFMKPGYELSKNLPRIDSKKSADKALDQGWVFNQVATGVVLSTTVMTILSSNSIQQVIDAIKSA
jgi:hypothetical protein